MERKFIVANWKMYLNRKISLEILRKLKTQNSKLKDLELVICPSFPFLKDASVLTQGTKLKLGAQDCFWQKRGAYTGEVSPEDLKEIGCKYVLIGHSERRRYLNEASEMLKEKIKAAMSAGLIPIFCVGENLAERKLGKSEEVISREIKAVFSGLKIPANKKLVVAYEPIWAIGTGTPEEPEEAGRMHKLIKKILTGFKLPALEKALVIYGGSVDASNVSLFLSQPGVDGVLIGGASAKIQEFLKIIKLLS